MSSFAELVSTKDNVQDLYKIARYMYRVGAPVMNDTQYDKLDKWYKNTYPSCPYSLRSYDDDPVPTEELRKWGYGFEVDAGMKLVEDSEKWEDIKEHFKDTLSKSIKPVENFGDALGWFLNYRGKDVKFSLKIDGINIKILLGKECGEWKLLMASTRSREGSGVDVSENISKILPNNLDFELSNNRDYLTIWGELHVKEKDLHYLREKYRKEFKTSRSTAISLARVSVEDKDYRHLHYHVFNSDYLSLTELEKSGFKLAPYKVIKGTEIPGTTVEFRPWLTEVLHDFWSLTKLHGIVSDGVVVEVADTNEFSSTVVDGRKYDGGNMALKLGPWEPNIYESVVRKVEFLPKKERFSVVLIVDPTLTQSGNVVRRVNAFNPDIVIKNNINIGSEVRFEYKGENAVNLIYGR